MPQLGEIRSGPHIGFARYGAYIYLACRMCGKGRWVRRNWTKRPTFTGLCLSCYNHSQEKSGNRSPHWNGGQSMTTDGYIRVWLNPSSPFFPMVTKQGFVLEHRLVMAQSLGRCLFADEVPHHIDGDRTNNVRSNLQLMTKSEHNALHDHLSPKRGSR